MAGAVRSVQAGGDPSKARTAFALQSGEASDLEHLKGAPAKEAVPQSDSPDSIASGEASASPMPNPENATEPSTEDSQAQPQLARSRCTQ